MPKHNPKICSLSLCRILGSMKQERVHWRHYQTRYEAQQDILNYISMYQAATRPSAKPKSSLSISLKKGSEIVFSLHPKDPSFQQG
jgi:hypothetical protein